MNRILFNSCAAFAYLGLFGTAFSFAELTKKGAPYVLSEVSATGLDAECMAPKSKATSQAMQECESVGCIDCQLVDSSKLSEEGEVCTMKVWVTGCAF